MECLRDRSARIRPAGWSRVPTSVTIDRSGPAIATVSHPSHEGCLVCGPCNHRGMNIVFSRGADGWTEARLRAGVHLQGYPRMMHGGVVSLLLDAAMTHCLFQAGCTAVTARMEIKFRRPVDVDADVSVRARLVRASPPAYQLRAELLQDGRVMASALGLFVHRPELQTQSKPTVRHVPASTRDRPVEKSGIS